MGALTDGDSSVCSTADYQPPEPEIVEEEEEEPDPLEPEACFTDSMNHLHVNHTACRSLQPDYDELNFSVNVALAERLLKQAQVSSTVLCLRLREALALSECGRQPG